MILCIRHNSRDTSGGPIRTPGNAQLKAQGRSRPNLADEPTSLYSFSRSSRTPLLLEEELGDLDGVERSALEQLVARDEHVDAVTASLGQLGPAWFGLGLGLGSGSGSGSGLGLGLGTGLGLGLGLGSGIGLGLGLGFGQLGPAVGAVGGDVVAHAAHQDLVEARDLVEGRG